jgi:hypothetical protein
MAPQELRMSCSRVTLWVATHLGMVDIQDDQKVSVHLITIQKTRKNILNSFNHHDNVVRIRDNRWP